MMQRRSFDFNPDGDSRYRQRESGYAMHLLRGKRALSRRLSRRTGHLDPHLLSPAHVGEVNLSMREIVIATPRVMVVMDQFTLRIIGFAVHPGVSELAGTV